jgi:hypothetical protein
MKRSNPISPPPGWRVRGRLSTHKGKRGRIARYRMSRPAWLDGTSVSGLISYASSVDLSRDENRDNVFRNSSG